MTTQSPSADIDAPKTYGKYSFLYVALVLLALTLLMFRNVLFSTSESVVSSHTTDTFAYFLAARDFAATQMRSGHIPGWNPTLFSGTPFVGNAQSAVFYPLNLIFLWLPLHAAINWSVALHIFFTGLWMALWSHKRGLHPMASLLSGAMLMFGGAYFLKIYAGHLAPLNAMAWTPLILCAVDLVIQSRSRLWWLVGTGAIAMQMLAGHPQTVFNTVVAVAIYGVLRLFVGRHKGSKLLLQKAQAGLSIIGMFVAGGALSAVQLLPIWQVTQESTRGHGEVPIAFTSTFSLPQENLLTLLVPSLFGDMNTVPYWGRFYLWEMSLFLGVTGLVLAIYGVLYGRDKTRWLWGATAVALLILALGSHTFLYTFLYHYAPGFSKFRAMSRFIIQASVFMSLLAALGLDTFLRAARGVRKVGVALAIVTVVLAGAAMGVAMNSAPSAGAGWGQVLTFILNTHDIYASPDLYHQPGFIQTSGLFAAHGLWVCTGVCALLAVLFFVRKKTHYVAYAAAVLGIMEVCIFANSTLSQFDLATARQPETKQFLIAHPGDYRILDTNPGNGFDLNAQDIWGYDPVILGRYAEFISHTQHQNPDDATAFAGFSSLSPLYRMLRMRFIVFHSDGADHASELPGPLPHVLLVSHWSQVTNRDAAFSAMDDPKFDSAKTVLLETTPNPLPVATDHPGTVRLVSSTSDTLTIEAQTSTPSILLVTDSYSKAWRAVSLAGSSQSQYEILPANYVLRAIPLAAGTHRLRLEYAPVELLVGEWISGAALLLYLGAIGFCWRKRVLSYRELLEGRRAVTTIPK